MKYFDLSFTIGKAAGRFSVPTSVCDEKILTVAKKCTNLFRMGGMIPDVIRGCLTIDNKVSYAYNAKTMSDSEYYFDKFLGFTEGDKKGKEKYFKNIYKIKDSNLFIENDLPIEQHKNKPSIVFLVESPHKDEYVLVDDTIKPLRPANGITGIQIINNITTLIMASGCTLPAGEYNLIICNAIPFQTSLSSFYKGGTNNELRDYIWNELWKLEAVPELLESKLSAYSPSLLFNGCMSTNTANGKIRDKIQKFLDERFPTMQKVQTPHPSLFHNIDNCKIIK